MNSFIARLIICLTPCVIALAITGNAVSKYVNGQSGGFKLGVDLVGGTILVYEIDKRKALEDIRGSKTTDATRLAESLKKRIDPNDLYNIVIRPAGGEGRVEIILPTGGAYRTRIAEENWDNNVLKYFQDKYKLDKLEVGRGRVGELAEEIHLRLSERKWEDKIFGTKEAWAELLKAAEERPDWVVLQSKKEELDKLPVGKLDPFVEFVHRTVGGTTNQNVVRLWVKDQAWKDLLERAISKDKGGWEELKEHEEELNRIPRDSFEQLVTFIQMKGNVINQAAIAALQPFLGNDIVSGGSQFNDRKKITKFIEDNYGPSLETLTKQIQTQYEKGGATRDLTLEEVQRIKDLVARVGSLEFRILANKFDDAEAIKDTKALIASIPADELRKMAQEGKLPPAPTTPDGKPKFYTLKLARNQKSRVSYSWAEIGKQQRHELHLDNASKTDPKYSRFWDQLAGQNRDKALQLEDSTVTKGGRQIFQGALFYSRDCRDRNLPEAERNDKKVEYFILTRNPETINPDEPLETRLTPKINGDYLRKVEPDLRGTKPAVSFVFNETGGDLFGNLTRKNVPAEGGSTDTLHRHLAIILDGQVSSAPTINSEIRTHGQISGSFTSREVNELVRVLRSGALPASLKSQPVSESTMGPSLGQDTITRALIATGWALAAVIVFMLVYYRFAGLVASIAVLANLLITVAFMVAVQATFTLPGLAGLVLMLGMAVDANVLIYERLREERERGATLAMALRNGYDRALPTIIDTHLTSIFTAIVLYVVGNDQLKGFGVSLTAGLVISLFTSLYMTRLMFDFWLARGWLHKLSMMRFFSQPDIDFMAVRKYWFTATIVLSILGVAMFIARIPNDLNIDFRGGTAYSGELTKEVDVLTLRDYVDGPHQKELLKIKKDKNDQPMVTEKEGDNDLRYEVVYENPDGTTETRSLQLVEKPKFVTVREREADVARRLGEVPDASVEQLFLSNYQSKDSSKSPYFKVRTSERETEIVQTTLDRVLREKQEKGKEQVSLIRRVYMFASPMKDIGTRLYFYDQATPKDFDPSAEYRKKPEAQHPVAYASPSFVKTLFTREMLDVFGKKKPEELPVVFGVEGDGKSKDGRFQSMTVEFSDKLTPDQLEKAQTALDKTVSQFAQRPQPDSLEVFDSQLSSETRERAMWAIVASWGAILLYLWFRFGSWTFGLAAVLCLVHDLAFSIGIVAACHFVAGTWFGNMLLLEDFKIDLTAVAAFLTLVGYSVCDTIVVFDRIREVRGKNPELTPQMINDSINQTLSRTLLTSTTTFLVVLVLYIIGGPGVHLFSFIIMIGVAIGTYSSIYIASPLLLILGEGTRKTTGRERQPQAQKQGASA